MLYFLPDRTFQHAGGKIIKCDEWVSFEAVELAVKLAVEPKDFYYLDKVSIHDAKESNLKTWLMYKMRNVLGRRVHE